MSTDEHGWEGAFSLRIPQKLMHQMVRRQYSLDSPSYPCPSVVSIELFRLRVDAAIHFEFSRRLQSPTNSQNANGFSSNQRTVLWVLWLTYGSLYFCRT